MSSTTAINEINSIDANYSTVNVVGGDQITINRFHVDHNCNTGKPMNQLFELMVIFMILDKVYQWLSAVIPSTNYHGALNARLEDTGLWFINGARFARWKAETDNFLWICGTRMYSYHLRVIMDTELLLQLVPERPS